MRLIVMLKQGLEKEYLVSAECSSKLKVNITSMYNSDESLILKFTTTSGEVVLLGKGLVDSSIITYKED